MTDKFVSKVIALRDVRLAFARVHKPQARVGKDGKPKGEPKFSATFLLDPSNTEHAATIKEFKAEAKRCLDHRFGAGTWPKKDFHLCFGLGNDLDKVYDGFAGMFYIKAADKERPLLGNRAGKVVVEGDSECPYSGCFVNAKVTVYSFDNESKGLNTNLRSVQFVRNGEAFGGGGARRPEDEFEALGDAPGKDAFDDSFG